MKLLINETKNIFGEIKVSGSKNACLPILTLSLLTKEMIHLTNVPNIKDVDNMLELLKLANVKVVRCIETNEVMLQRKRVKSKINSNYINEIRASYYLMGALYSVKKEVITKFPGGCNFDKRPIDYHLDAFKMMNTQVCFNDYNIIIKRRKKHPINITLKTKSLGTTINIILATVLTKGTTIINNPSLEPEVLDFICVLKKMNASIKINNNSIIIEGVKKLNGATHKIMPDRIEAGSYICLAAAVEKSNILLKNININHLEEVLNTFRKSGLYIYNEGRNIRIIKNKPLNNMKIIADDYPNFPTDLQQLMVSVMLSCNNISLIKDNIYPNRYSQVFELLKMNGQMYLKNNYLLIFPSKLIGKEVFASDLRGGFALIIAALISKGITTINHSEVILRGYEALIKKLEGINVFIKEI